MRKIIILIFLAINLTHSQIYKESILDTNQVTTHFNNRGSMWLHWPGGIHSLLYSFQGLLIGGEVINSQGDTIYIFSDGFIGPEDGDFEPGTTNPWGWLALSGYDNPLENIVALSNDMTSWAPSWTRCVPPRWPLRST